MVGVVSLNLNTRLNNLLETFVRDERTFVRDERTFVREERTFVRDEGMSHEGRGHESREPTFRATVKTRSD